MYEQYEEYGPMEKMDETFDMDQDPIPRPPYQSDKGSRSNLNLRLGRIPWYTSGFQ